MMQDPLLVAVLLSMLPCPRFLSVGNCALVAAVLCREA